MGTTGQVGVAEFLFGTLAERILSQVDCSVLAVKPKGFVSAVDA
jgi:nucleotide-binding universal stress UspA family protein